MMQQKLDQNSPLDAWLAYLEHLHSKNIDMGLERVKSVAQQLNLLNPSAFVITVAGTNGKGTTCRLLETLLLNAGYRVGVYSSPHILRYNERVRIQGAELPDQMHSRAFSIIEQQRNQSLTYFEFSTLAALLLFQQADLDVIILEVGLGGRLDATNIIDTDLAIITSIDIDHIAFLGNNREQIGFEKAGICRENTPLVVGEPDCPISIKQVAEKLHCPSLYREKDFSVQQTDQDWAFQIGTEQWQHLPFCHIPLQNAATALAALKFLPFKITLSQIKQSLQNVALAGRFQFLSQEQYQNLAQRFNVEGKNLPQIVLDVGHNPHAARYLATQLAQKKANYRHIYAICGILQDKDAAGVLTPLLPFITAWICVPLAGERGQSAIELQRKLQLVTEKNHNLLESQAVNSMLQGVDIALNKTQKEDLLLIFGSFHTVADFLNVLGND